MNTKAYIEAFYDAYDEDGRLASRHGAVEFAVTMTYIERYAKPGMRILEIGAGTGRYSHTLARRGFCVDAVELAEHNIELFRRNTAADEPVTIRQGDARDLSAFADETYDVTLLLGPMYHLFTRGDQSAALAEAVRVTKRGGVVFAAYCMRDAAILQYGFVRGNVLRCIEQGMLDPESFETHSEPKDVFEQGGHRFAARRASGYAAPFRRVGRLHEPYTRDRRRDGRRGVCRLAQILLGHLRTAGYGRLLPSYNRHFSEKYIRSESNMEHKGTKELRTERLLLRRFTPADAQAMYDNWACDAQVTRFLTWQPHASPAATAALLAGWCESYARPSYYNWTLEYERRPVGNISVVRLDEETSCAELGYCLGRAYWGWGLMAEAASAVIGFLFDEAGVRRVCISHAVGNPASGRVAQKCGLTFVETRPQAYRTSDGRLHDLNVYAVTHDEWAAKK